MTSVGVHTAEVRVVYLGCSDWVIGYRWDCLLFFVFLVPGQNGVLTDPLAAFKPPAPATTQHRHRPPSPSLGTPVSKHDSATATVTTLPPTAAATVFAADTSGPAANTAHYLIVGVHLPEPFSPVHHSISASSGCRYSYCQYRYCYGNEHIGPGVLVDADVTLGEFEGQ